MCTNIFKTVIMRAAFLLDGIIETDLSIIIDSNGSGYSLKRIYLKRKRAVIKYTGRGEKSKIYVRILYR